MRGWLLANLFFVAMACVAGALLVAGVQGVRLLGLEHDTARALIGGAALAAIILTGVIAYYVLKRLERRR